MLRAATQTRSQVAQEERGVAGGQTRYNAADANDQLAGGQNDATQDVAVKNAVDRLEHAAGKGGEADKEADAGVGQVEIIGDNRVDQRHQPAESVRDAVCSAQEQQQPGASAQAGS